MGLLRRRFPLYARPLPLFVFFLLAFFLIKAGLNWDWRWSLQTGNIFLLILVPDSFLSWEGGRVFYLMVGIATLGAAFAWGAQGRRSAQADARRGVAWWRRSTLRFYPMTFLFGVFVLYYGLVFLFDASVYGDRAPGGYVAFIYLDYAGLTDRPFVTGIGSLIASLGLLCATFLAFDRSDLRPVRRTPQGASGPIRGWGGSLPQQDLE